MPIDLRQFIKKINATVPFSGFLKFNEPMAKHTTFRTGGPADLFVRPKKHIFLSWTQVLLKAAKAEGVPVFILGGGANLLVSDKGIRGIVLDTGAWRGVTKQDDTVKVLSGSSIDKTVNCLAAMGLSGLEFLAGMPGTTGGALWMNARCYEKSVSDVLAETQILDENFDIVTVPFNAEHFSYKKSPFQARKVLILNALFKVNLRNKRDIKKEMAEYRNDRKKKGHYRYPSAGSVFKNNHAFGAPTGKIIDELGLKGLCKGGASIAPWHGNFIINTGRARSEDIRFLIEEIAKIVKEKRGFELEPEIIFAGEW
ncbi:MAG: UDP-N-acetylmuramate dehydrogenase [Treponema sp.]|jgi:UDP-N-acetylmuramate dehydrogenase|nr:UDP-N-acetylmuramate dehydrogenase [Treponema sp.]